MRNRKLNSVNWNQALFLCTSMHSSDTTRIANEMPLVLPGWIQWMVQLREIWVVLFEFGDLIDINLCDFP